MSVACDPTGDGPLVSVIIPAYNAERFLAETLDSVLHQTHRNLEVIVVDDGAMDATREIAEGFAENDSRVRVFSQPNAGVCAARNRALDMARGEFVAPVDADDIWHPDKLRLQLEVFSHATSNTGVVYTWSAYMSEDGKFFGDGCASREEGDVYVKLLCCNFVGNGSAALIRRSCIERCGNYREDVPGCEDQELLARLAERYEFRVVPQFLVGYRQVRQSVSHNSRMLEQSHQNFMRQVAKRHPEIPQVIHAWSKGVLCSFLASRCAHSRDYSGALRYFLMATRYDLACLTRLPNYLLSAVRLPLVSAFGRSAPGMDRDAARRNGARAVAAKADGGPSLGHLGEDREVSLLRPFGALTLRRMKFIEGIRVNREPAQ